jgi:stearoyl-CoA desaturase (delta-9 desaturase)
MTTPPTSPPVFYDGRSPFPDESIPEEAGTTALRAAVTMVLVVGPLLGLAAVAWMLWDRAFSSTDLAIAAVFYVVTGFGITLGFHRGLTHRGFRMSRPLQLVLVSAGSMAFEGAVIDWVATHRRHHAFTDRPGDPHSPYRYGTSLRGQVRGLGHAHVGWLLVNSPTSSSRYAPDLLRDPMIVRLDAAFPWFCIASLALPFLVGAAVTASWVGGLTAFLWAGLARVAVLQHVTWSVNSLCHVVGRRPYRTRKHDRATNLWALALVSFGESWHNGHHADPVCARHGRARGQLDPSATLIRLFERLHWVTAVRWPAGPPEPAARDEGEA